MRSAMSATMARPPETLTPAFTSAEAAPPAAIGALPGTLPRALMIAAAACGVMAGLLAQDSGASAQAAAQAGADLTRLLRAMAALKAGMAMAACAAIWWRLAVPVGLARLVGYAAAAAAMTCGTGLIWQMVHVAAGAAALHAGLAAAVILLWRDPATGSRLAAIVAARRGRA